jgi:hypothetical protein
MSIKNDLLFNDDHKISGYLASKNIRRISIGENCTNYIFKRLVSQQNALSGRSFKLLGEHYRIIKYFQRHGLYKELYTPLKSLGFYVLFILILSLIMFFKFPKCYRHIYVLFILVYIKMNIMYKMDRNRF